eukprot:2552250-Pyramimonas_sp.AAC.1
MVNHWEFGKRTYRFPVNSSTQRPPVQGLGGPEGKVEGLPAGPCLTPIINHLRELRALGKGSPAGRLATAVAGGSPA